MKKLIKVFLLISTFILLAAFLNVCYADSFGPPSGHGLFEDQGFDAFVGDGVTIFLILAVEYLLYQVYKIRFRPSDES
jgi:hypothetical protein